MTCFVSRVSCFFLRPLRFAWRRVRALWLLSGMLADSEHLRAVVDVASFEEWSHHSPGLRRAVIDAVERELKANGRLRRLLMLVPLAFALCLQTLTAATTTIADTLYAPDLSTLSGRIQITNAQFKTAEGLTIGRGEINVTVSNGAFSVALEANDGATPPGTSYRVWYRMNNGVQWLEFWVVPTSGTPLKIADVRVIEIPQPWLMVLIAQLGAGGASTNDCLVFNGSAWTPGPCAANAGVIPCAEPLTELTLDAAGAITIPSNACYAVDTFADAASDDIESIVCGAGAFFVLRAANAGRTVVVKDDNAALNIQADFSLDDLADSIYLKCETTNTVTELTRASGGI